MSWRRDVPSPSPAPSPSRTAAGAPPRKARSSSRAAESGRPMSKEEAPLTPSRQRNDRQRPQLLPRRLAAAASCRSRCATAPLRPSSAAPCGPRPPRRPSLVVQRRRGGGLGPTSTTTTIGVRTELHVLAVQALEERQLGHADVPADCTGTSFPRSRSSVRCSVRAVRAPRRGERVALEVDRLERAEDSTALTSACGSIARTAP